MGLADKLFGGKKSVSQSKGVKADPEPDPQLIQMYDEYGREVSITKKDWREKVLPNNLKKVRNDPERLYSMLVSAIGDGLASEIVPYAEHLQRTDPIPSRGTTILGIVYMEAGRLDDAQRLYDDFLAGHGEDGVVLTNLAKVYSLRGDNQRAETILWHALEVDPNQEKGLGWYLAIKRERNGESAVLDALRSIAGLPGSWRAQLWLAKDALQRRDLTAAQVLYGEALAAAGRPVPADLLMQMSGYRAVLRPRIPRPDGRQQPHQGQYRSGASGEGCPDHRPTICAEASRLARSPSRLGDGDGQDPRRGRSGRPVGKDARITYGHRRTALDA
jgi:tetratricopeptide (TPR) repeat protein